MIGEMLMRCDKDLLVSMLIIFTILRTKDNLFSVPRRLLHKIKVFLIPEYGNQGGTEPKTVENILNLGPPITINDHIVSKSYLTRQLFYKVYDNMVNVGLVAFLLYLWFTVYHCFVPDATITFWGSAAACLSTVFALQSQIQIVYLTGWNARESKVALVSGVIAFILSLILLNVEYDILHVSLDKAIAEAADHFNALLMQLSKSPLQLNQKYMIFSIKLFLSISVWEIVVGMIVPMLRFSQTLYTLLFGYADEAAPNSIKIILIIDFFLPLLVGCLYNGIIASKLGLDDNSSLAVQIVASFLMISLRWWCMRIHLQCFVNSVLRSVKLHMAALSKGAVAATSVETLKTRIRTRINYLVPCASQYFAHIIFIASICILIHRSSPNGINVCPSVRTLFGLDLDVLMKANEKERQFDATKVAIEVASKPYLDNAIIHFLMGAGIGGISPSAKLIEFLEKAFTQLRFLPVGTFVTFGKAAMCVYCFSYFFFNVLGVLYWKLYPGMYLLYSGGVMVNLETIKSEETEKKDK